MLYLILFAVCALAIPSSSFSSPPSGANFSLCLSQLSTEELNGQQVFTARCLSSNSPSPCAAVSLRFQLGFDASSTTSKPMHHGLDGSWIASLSPPPGALLRWSMAAYDSAGRQLCSADGAPVVALASLSGGRPGAALPTLHWFDGSGFRRYANVSAHRTGSERHDPRGNLFNRGKSKDWAKTNYKLSFHKSAGSDDDQFLWAADVPAVKSIEMHGFFQESGPNSYMRKTLAMRFMNQNGIPAPATRYVRVMQNGAFLGLYAFIELVDSSFLKRHGLNASALLFKASHWKYSNLRSPDNRLECPFTTPELDYWPRGRGTCPQIFSEEGYPYGRTPDLGLVEALATRISAGDLSAFDRDNVVGEMAVQAAMLHQDRCTKNHIYYESSGKWLVLPYDMKDAFATDNRGDGRNCSAEGNACSNAASYCILSCPSFNSPLFCDRDHPQDTFPDSDGRSTWNHLVDAVLQNPVWRTAYLKRLYEVMQNYLSTGWLQAQVAQIYGQIADAAREDDKKWGAGNIDVGVKALLLQLSARRDQLYGQYGPLFAPFAIADAAQHSTLHTPPLPQRQLSEAGLGALDVPPAPIPPPGSPDASPSS